MIFKWLMLIISSLIAIGAYCLKPKKLNDDLISAGFNQGALCVYHDRIPDDEGSHLPDNSCLFEGGETGYELSPDVDAFISQLIERDYSGYQRVDSWISLVEKAYAVADLQRIQWNPLVKVVWLCSSPETQRLTTNSEIFSLCSARPNQEGTGYESAVRFYEFRKAKSGFIDRQIFQEIVEPKKAGATSVLLSVDFRLFNGKLLATIEKHLFSSGEETRKVGKRHQITS